MPGASPLPEALPTTWAMAASPVSSSSIEVSSTYCSLPWAAEGIKSTLTEQETILGLCEKFSIPADYKPSCAGGDGRACKAPPHLKGCICVYEAALDAGMRVPLHPFYSKLLQHYGLAPSQLTPNSWRYMAAFIVLCSDIGLKPRLSVLRHFFTVSLYTHNNRDGWHVIKLHKMSEYDRRGRLFSTSRCQLSNNEGWKERFLFLSSPTGTWPCPIMWGKPTKEAAGDPKLSMKAKEDIQKLYNVQGSTGVDLMSLLAKDKLARALAQATHVRKGVNFCATGARIELGTPKSTTDVCCPVTPPGGSTTRDQVLLSARNEHGDDWLRTILKKAADVVIEESSLLRQQLNEARQSEAVAKAELSEARMSEMANKADLDNVRKSETAAKTELVGTQTELAAARTEIDKIRKSEAAAKAELQKVRKSEAAAMAELLKVRKSEAVAKADRKKQSESEEAAKAEIAATKAKLEEMRKSEIATKSELIIIKAQLDEAKKSEVSIKAKLAAAKDMVQKTGNEYFEDFLRLHNLMMDGFESAFGIVSKSPLDATLPGTGNRNKDSMSHEGGSGSPL